MTVLAVALFGAAAGRLSGQGAVPSDPAVVDRIVAVVGTHSILWSDVSEEVFARVSSHRETLPNQTKDSVEFERQFNKLARRYVDTLVAFELLYEEAATDTTIKVTDQEVGDAVDLTMQNARKTFKSEADYRVAIKELGFATPDDWRTSLLEKQRHTLVVSRYTETLRDDKKLKPMTPSEKELRAFYEANKEMWGNNGESVALRQIVVAPKPSEAERARAHGLADSLVTALRAGADFAKVAHQFSQDPVSAAKGGDLDWFRRGIMAREFEDAAFSLLVGQISNVVESPFGFHIIQVQRIGPGEIQARHILIIPEPDSAAQRAAHDRAFEIRAALVAGASFDSLQHLAHDRSEEQELFYPVDALAQAVDENGPQYLKALAGVDSGKFSQPFELPTHPVAVPNRSKWAVVQLSRRVPAGPSAYVDVKDRLRQMLAGMMGEQDYITQLRKRTYVDIRDP